MNNRDIMRERRHRYHTWARAFDSSASAVGDRGRWFQVTTACLSALVSSAIFTSLAADEVSVYWKVITAVVSLAATILGAAAAALAFTDRATAYRKAALACVGLQHRAEELIVAKHITDDDVAAYDAKAAKIEQAFPTVISKAFRKAETYCNAQRSSDPFERLDEARSEVTPQTRVAAGTPPESVDTSTPTPATAAAQTPAGGTPQTPAATAAAPTTEPAGDEVRSTSKTQLVKS